jgi:metal-sulfur cluster biosynthetic enzyme
MDPELGLSVMDLGLIYGIEIGEASVHVKMTLTTMGCPIHESMIAAVKSMVEKLDASKTVEVELVWEPRWTPDRMSEHARETLGW